MGRRYFGGNSGYVGYSKSVRAVDAERRGLRSKSQMDSSFADEVNELLPENEKVTLKQIKSALSSIRADEWHHTSMYGNKTDYYSAETIADYFRKDEVEIEESKPKTKVVTSEDILKHIPYDNIKFHIGEFKYDAKGYKAKNGLYVIIGAVTYPPQRASSMYVVDEVGGRWSYDDAYYTKSFDEKEFVNAVNEYNNVLVSAQKKAQEENNLSLQSSTFGILMF